MLDWFKLRFELQRSVDELTTMNDYLEARVHELEWLERKVPELEEKLNHQLYLAGEYLHISRNLKDRAEKAERQVEIWEAAAKLVGFTGRINE